MRRENEEKAKELLHRGEYTLVLCREESVLTDTRRGVAPLLALLDEEFDLTDYAAADRVVGKAAAFLYLQLGVASVYGAVMSRPAYDLLDSHGVQVACGHLVDAIRNRAGDGFCPMETVCLPLEDAAEAERAIRTRLAELVASKP